MRDYNTIAALFGNSDNSGSINFLDYASVKNGSYGKLLKAYYAKDTDSKTTSDSKSKTDKTNTAVDKLSTNAAKVKNNSDELIKAANNLDDDSLWKVNTSSEYDKDKISGNVEAFIKDYNSVIDSVKNADSTAISDSTKWMTSLTNVMSKTLGKIGITVGDDNKLSLDKDTLKSADIKTIKSLFDGKNSYGQEIASKASSISSAAVNSTSLYSANGTASNSVAGLFNQFI